MRLDLNSIGVMLQPNSRYSYAVVATNAAGETSGDGGIFSTPAQGVVNQLNTTTSPGLSLTTGPSQNAGQSAVTPAATDPLGNVRPSRKTRVLTKAQKRAKAVRVCKRKPRKRRAICTQSVVRRR